MKSKIGLHINNLFGGADDWMRTARPQVVMSLDHSPDRWQALRNLSPATFIIGRFVEYDDGDPRYYPTGDGDTPATARQKASRYFADSRATMERMGALYDAWVGINEPICHTNQHAQNLSAWYAQWGDLMRAAGLKSVAYTFSQGVPEPFHWPLLAEGLSHCDLLGLHEYWCPHLNSPDIVPFHSLRYRSGFANLPADARRQIVITECGVDGGAADLPTAGYKHFVGEGEYLADLQAYDAELQKDPYVIGATIYCANCGDFASWDVADSQIIPAWIGSTGAPNPVVIAPPHFSSPGLLDQVTAAARTVRIFGSTDLVRLPEGTTVAKLTDVSGIQVHGFLDLQNIRYFISEFSFANRIPNFFPAAATFPPDQPTDPASAAQAAALARRSTWMAINTNAALYRFAQQHTLGYPQTDEFSFISAGAPIIVQVYNSGIVYVRDSDFENVKSVAKPGQGPAPTDALALEVQQTAFARQPTWMAINVNASLYRYAQSHNLGYPQTDEFSFTFGPDAYIGQVYNGGIVYVKSGDFANVRQVPKPPGT